MPIKQVISDKKSIKLRYKDNLSIKNAIFHIFINNHLIMNENCGILWRKGRDAMITSAGLQEKILSFLADGAPHSIQEIKTHLEEENITDYTEGQFSGSINTLLRNQTIEKRDRAVYALSIKGKGGQDFMKYCFVVSPIGEAGSTTRDHADKLLKHIIIPVCQSCGFKVERVDQMTDFNSITQTIIDQLQSADLVIADISDHNPNVFYEMGYRKCTGRPIIHLKKKGDSIPFDVNTIRTFEYDLADLDSEAEIKERLQQAITAFSFDEAQEVRESNRVHEKDMANVMPMLYEIQDSITELKEEISRKDTETIEAIMQTSLNTAVAAKKESMSSSVVDALLPEMLKNPQLFANLQMLAKMADKNNS